MSEQKTETAPWPDWQVESAHYYTGAECLRCGKLLGTRIPAEIYAGTFNGLCYGCTAASPYVTRVSLLDGAQVLSYPPHCPSWRRDREEFTAYPDCATCNGSGVQGRGRSVGGDSYPEYCKPCIQRYSAHPVRTLQFSYLEKLQKSATRAYQRRLTLAAGLNPSTSRKRQEAAWDALDPGIVAAIRAEVMGRYRSLKARHEARIERLGANAWRPPAAEKASA